MLRTFRRRVASAVIVVLASGLLAVSALGPAHADDAEPHADAVVIDAGNEVAVVIDPETRLFSITTPTPLAFDSLTNATSSDVYDWGTGWGFGNVSVTSDRSFTFPRLGTFAYDPASPTRLRGYPRTDVVAFVTRGTLPPRGDTIPEQQYQALLYHRDTRTTDYFDLSGWLIASTTDDGGRTDWEYRPPEDGTPTLLRIRHADDSVTRIDRMSEFYYRVVEGDGTVRFLQTTAPGSTSERLFRYFGDREFTEFDHMWPGGEGALRAVRTRDLSTGAQTVVELEWDGWGTGVVERVLRNGEVVFPVDRESAAAAAPKNGR